jgi:hypothetical protein
VPLLAPDAMFPAGAQCFWPSRTFVVEVQPSVPSVPKAGTASKDHPCAQNSRDMSSIGVSVKPMMQKSLRVTETARTEIVSLARRGTKLPKAIFPNSSPSSVRAVLTSRWAELTTNPSRGEEWASELPWTAHADADPSKRRVLPFENFTVVRSCYWGKMVNSIVIGAIIGAHLI